ncbi:Reverse transcriptase domain [Trinorchestia longiramus]|nr:Reverse transcriptase domain [Trinorchestia longiramus]
MSRSGNGKPRNFQKRKEKPVEETQIQEEGKKKMHTSADGAERNEKEVSSNNLCPSRMNRNPSFDRAGAAPKLNFEDYAATWYPPVGGVRGGGLAILVRLDIPFHSLRLEPFDGSLELQGVILNTVSDLIAIINVYNRSQPFSFSELRLYLQHLNHSFHIPGDFNAHLPLWDERSRTNSAYRVLEEMLDAFPSVLHERLIYKLIASGLEQTYVKWLKDYLTGRTASLRLWAVQSEGVSIAWRLPRGVVLSLLLFNIMLSDIPVVDLVQLILYANDIPTRTPRSILGVRKTSPVLSLEMKSSIPPLELPLEFLTPHWDVRLINRKNYDYTLKKLGLSKGGQQTVFETQSRRVLDSMKTRFPPRVRTDILSPVPLWSNFPDFI